MWQEGGGGGGWLRHSEKHLRRQWKIDLLNHKVQLDKERHRDSGGERERQRVCYNPDRFSSLQRATAGQWVRAMKTADKKVAQKSCRPKRFNSVTGNEAE